MDKREMNLRTSIVIILISVSLIFAELSFTVTTDVNSVTIGEQVIITAKVVSDKKLKNPTQPKVPASADFKVLRTSSNQSQSTSIQMINGKMTRSVNITYLYYYFITPTKKDGFTFPALTFRSGSKEYNSTPFKISGKTGETLKAPKDVLFRMELSKTKLYKGEQAILTAKIIQHLTNRIELSNSSFVNVIEQVEKTFGHNFAISRLFANQIGQTIQIINGKQVKVFTLAFSLIPLKEGNIILPSIPFEYYQLREIRSRNRDPFDNFFGGNFFGSSLQRVPVTVTSSSRKLEVLPLPGGAPSNFSGAVGNFKLTKSINEKSVKAGEAITLKIVVSGNTRAGNIGEIKLPKDNNFEVYRPEINSRIDTTAQGIFTRKSFKYLLIPQTEGKYKIPPVTFCYFNTTQKKYLTLTGKNLTIKVSKGNLKNRSKSTRYLTHEEIREVGRDIRYIKTPIKLTTENFIPYKSKLFLFLLPIPFIISIFSLLYKLQGKFVKKDPTLSRKRRALSKAKRSIQKLRKSEVSAEHISKLSQILESYIFEKFHFSATGSTLSDLKDNLENHISDKTVIEKLTPFIEKLDSFRFSGLTSDNSSFKNTTDELEILITELDSREITK